MRAPLLICLFAVVTPFAAVRADVVSSEYTACWSRKPGDRCGNGTCKYEWCYHPGSQKYGDAGERLGCLMCSGLAQADAGEPGGTAGGCSQGPSNGSALGAAVAALAGGLGLLVFLRRRDGAS